MKILRHFALSCSLLATSACDVGSILPKTADEGGRASAQLGLRVGVVGLAGLPDGVQAMKFALVDVMAHRQTDDTWVVLSGAPMMVDLGDAPGTVVSAGLPVSTGGFDRVLVVFGDVSATDAGGDSSVHVTKSELEIEVDADFTADAAFLLDLDVSGAVKGKPGKWSLTPKVEAMLLPQD